MSTLAAVYEAHCTSRVFNAVYNAHIKRAHQQGFRPMGPLVFSVLTMQLCFF